MSADLLGISRDFTWRGLTHKLAPRDLHVQAVFADWVRSQAALDLWKLKAKVPADFYREQMEIYGAKLAGRQFEWGGRDVHDAAWSESGRRQLLWLKIQRGVEKGGMPIERETVDEIAKDAEKWEELLRIYYEQDEPDFFARYKQEMEAQTKEQSPPPAPSPPATA